MISTITKTAASNKLSPTSANKLQALNQPVKGAVADYDKALTSAEASVRKAMQTLEKNVKEVKLEEERKAAHEERLKTLRGKKMEAVSADMEKARQSGLNDAEAEAAADEISEASGGQSDAESEDDKATIAQTVKLLGKGTGPGFSSLSDFPAVDVGAVPFLFTADKISLEQNVFTPDVANKFASENPTLAKSCILTNHLAADFGGLTFLNDIFQGNTIIEKMIFGSIHIRTRTPYKYTCQTILPYTVVTSSSIFIPIHTQS